METTTLSHILAYIFMGIMWSMVGILIFLLIIGIRDNFKRG
nr:MAG TPA: hypothetical protein [Caudoviricetes sp.]